MIDPAEVREMILASLPDAEVEVSDMRGTGDHFEILVVSKAFAGKSLIEQHKMVFSALEKEMDQRIHAVQLKTQVPKK